MDEPTSAKPDAEQPALVLPRVLAFYQDTWADDGTAIGWRTVAWGLALTGGAAVTVPIEGPPTATLWPSVDDAATALDAYVDTPAPARRLVESKSHRDVRASTTSSLRSSDGTAAQPARPLDPAEAAGDGPLGHDQAGAES
jgi:hypothetical protein